MKKRKPTTKWADLRSELVRRLTNEVSVTSVTADSNVSQTKTETKPSKMVKPLTNIERLNLPKNVEKRKAGFKAYWENRRKRSATQQKWKEANGLTSCCFTIPDELLEAFKAKAKHCGTNKTAVITELMLDYITRPDKS